MSPRVIKTTWVLRTASAPLIGFGVTALVIIGGWTDLSSDDFSDVVDDFTEGFRLLAVIACLIVVATAGLSTAFHCARHSVSWPGMMKMAVVRSCIAHGGVTMAIIVIPAVLFIVFFTYGAATAPPDHPARVTFWEGVFLATFATIAYALFFGGVGMLLSAALLPVVILVALVSTLIGSLILPMRPPALAIGHDRY